MSSDKCYQATEMFEQQVIDTVRNCYNLIKNKNFNVISKGTPSNIVTSNDIEIQNLLCEALGALIPDSGFLGEEGLTRSGGDYVWVIDPIDGTMNYSRGIAECAISVALLYKGEAVLGVVYNMLTGDVFSATQGLGARLNSKKNFCFKQQL